MTSSKYSVDKHITNQNQLNQLFGGQLSFADNQLETSQGPLHVAK